MHYKDYEINKLKIDEWGRKNGILAIDKQIGDTSHDVVDKVRRLLGTRAVGHAGALDPFASGLLLVIVGKATKLSDELMNQAKVYQAKVLFGVASTSQDTEGEVVSTSQHDLDEAHVAQIMDTMREGYQQFVPVFSSVKVGGQKLRVLARQHKDFAITMRDGHKFATFGKTVVEIPSHFVDFTQLELVDFAPSNIEQLDQDDYQRSFATKLAAHSQPAKMHLATLNVGCPKGTYVRQLAEDIGARLDPPTPAMLVGLRRIRIGSIAIGDTLTIEQLAAKYPNAEPL